MTVLAACDADFNPGKPLIGLLILLLIPVYFGLVYLVVFKPTGRGARGRLAYGGAVIVGGLALVPLASLTGPQALTLAALGTVTLSTCLAIYAPSGERIRVVIAGILGTPAVALVVADLFIALLVAQGGCPLD